MNTTCKDSVLNMWNKMTLPTEREWLNYFNITDKSKLDISIAVLGV